MPPLFHDDAWNKIEPSFIKKESEPHTEALVGGITTGSEQSSEAGFSRVATPPDVLGTEPREAAQTMRPSRSRSLNRTGKQRRIISASEEFELIERLGVSRAKDSHNRARRRIESPSRVVSPKPTKDIIVGEWRESPTIPAPAVAASLDASGRLNFRIVKHTVEGVPLGASMRNSSKVSFNNTRPLGRFAGLTYSEFSETLKRLLTGKGCLQR
jgi:hypothetical protein